MHTNITSQIISKYDGIRVDNRAFIKADGYACTVYDVNNTLFISFELPLLSKSTSLICDICNSIEFSCEYNYPSLNIEANYSNDDIAADDVCSLLDKITKLLKDNSVDPDICIKCHEKTSEYYNVNGYYSPIHKECANKILTSNTPKPAETKKTRSKGLIVGTSFAFFGSLSYIIFGLIGIMPSFGGILMGICAALGYRMFNKNIYKADKMVFMVVFLLFAAFSNFAADYVYAATMNMPLDFIATYTDPLNLFSTAFDVLSGAIIALCSISIVTDFDRHTNSVIIKKIYSKAAHTPKSATTIEPEDVQESDKSAN